MRYSIAHLHYITQEMEGHDLLIDIEEACKGGVRWVQLRLKNKNERDIIAIAKKVKGICQKYSAVFIVNDYANIAVEVDADGVHLGKQDMDITEARRLLGREKIIGGSTNSFEDIIKLNELSADYVGLGPFRFTTTKEKLNTILGEKGINAIMKKIKSAHIKIPVIAIGGIGLSDVEMLIDYGVYGVAVSSAINGANNIKGVAKNFMEALELSKRRVSNVFN